ncbi:MAG TPA: adenylate/guanylate cyclase domain-containing protein, partial [Leptospiraceae bacterium]|nr:adenylate/guanylate cyclase domain-containing protein [Leptospiraceae bacterium]
MFKNWVINFSKSKKINLLKNKIFPFMIFLVALYCKPMNLSESLILNGEHRFMQLQSLSTETPTNCEDFPEKIRVPASTSLYPKFKSYQYYAYCIPFSIDLTQRKDWGIFLGYIDNNHRIYLNGRLISSTEKKEEMGHTLFYENALIIPFDTANLLPDNVLIVKGRKFNLNSEDGGGIYAGILRIDEYEKLKTANQISKSYGLAKNVLFFSTSLLFFVLFLSRTNNKEYLWFAIFLFAITIYEFCRLELKEDLGIRLESLKYLEYLTLTLLLPIFSLFLYSILYKNKFHIIPMSIVLGGIVFFLLFFFSPNIFYVETLNYTYHVPFLIIVCVILFVATTRELIKKNKRAILVFISCFIPFTLTFFDLLNKKYQFFPILANIQVSGDSILVLVISMTFYTSYHYYSIQKKLDKTMHKEEMLRKTFQLYVPPRDIEKILSNYDANEELLNLGELEEKTILFCDIRNFTDLSEKLNPSQTVNFLNSYFKTFNRIIIENGGIIDKLIGDCIMARFDSGKEYEAIKCSLEMIHALLPYNRARRKMSSGAVNHGIGL